MQRVQDFVPSSAQQETLKTFFLLMLKKDTGKLGELLTDDVVQEHPYMPDLPGLHERFEGREQMMFHYRTVLEKRHNHSMYILSMNDVPEKRLVIVEAAGKSDVPETGKPYHQRYIIFFTFREDGKISHLREYFNPLVFQNAFEGFLVGKGAVPN